jgi:hypothetical protein
MSRHRNQPAFKATQVFDWANEPSDERPTDFGRSTGYSALSGYGALTETPVARRRQHERSHGFAKLLVSCVLFLAASVVGMMAMVRYLQA